MRRILSALTVLAASTAALAASDATARPASTPKLMVAKTSPVVVIGIGFGPRETVRVVVRTDERQSAKRVTASATGQITVRFARLTLERCADFVVAANGDKGSSARVHRFPAPCGIDPRAG